MFHARFVVSRILGLFGLVCLAPAVLGLPTACGQPQPPAAKPVYRLEVAADRKDALYKTGETVTWTIHLTRDRQPCAAGKVSYVVDDFITNRPPKNNLPSGSLELKDGRAEVSVTSDRPGFLRCRVSFRTPDKRPLQSVSGVGFSPKEIRPSLPVPDDFDSFWDENKKRLAKVDLDAKLTPVASNRKDVNCFDVQVACVAPAPVSGYLALPKDAQPKSLPAILWVHGAGVRSSSLANAIQGAGAGMLSMDINAHGIPNGRPAEFYRELTLGRLKNYRHDGRESRETSYFTGMFLRLVRAIDFLTSRPEWDGRVMAVIGHSQGGGQALVAGGIDPRVTMIAAGVPAICDHSGRAAGRMAGWPKLVPIGPDGQPDAKILAASRYVDAVNFASRCRAEAILSVGFIDTVCPPSSCYAAYNALQGEKQIINEPGMGHAAPRHIQNAFFKRILRHVKEHAAAPAKAE